MIALVGGWLYSRAFDWSHRRRTGLPPRRWTPSPDCDRDDL